MTVVVDASAVLALLWSEPGSEAVADVIGDALMSAVNLAEVTSKLADRGIGENAIRELLRDLPVRIAVFDEGQAYAVGEMRKRTRPLGLSIGDRACLGLAMLEDARVMTADKAWRDLEMGLDVVVIR